MGDAAGPEENIRDKLQAKSQLASNMALIWQYVKENKMETFLWLTRMLTITFTWSYLLHRDETSFNKVLFASISTSVLRLSQRLQGLPFNRDLLARFSVEDSSHYLMYAMTFLNVQSSIFIIMPLVLYALLHSTTYSIKIFRLVRVKTLNRIAELLSEMVASQTVPFLRAIAFIEILLMPYCMVMVLMGRAVFMTPLLYHYFLLMRYGSHRNPYTRQAFRCLRILAQELAHYSPSWLSKLIYKTIRGISRLACQTLQPPTSEVRQQPQPQPSSEATPDQY